MHLLRKLFVRSRSSEKSPTARRRRPKLHVEPLESRRLMAADIHVGVVYYEDASGFDELPDRFEITFVGGAPGSELTRLTIDTDKEGNGLTIGDVFFDTLPTPPGAFQASNWQIVSQVGIDQVDVSVDDGGTLLVFTFVGFHAGDKLVFEVDVDEQGFLGPNAVAEGNEFEGSKMRAEFKAPHYFDATLTDIFLDAYDFKLNGSGLDLPLDNYLPPVAPAPVRTAGAISSTAQIPLPITLSGTVYEDRFLDGSRDPADPGIAGVSLTLLVKNGSNYESTGLVATTDGNGAYRFTGLAPGIYRVVETQPAGYFSISANPGSVNGLVRGAVLDQDTLTEINLLGGEDSIHNDFGEARPVSVSGTVYHDANNNGLIDGPDEFGIGGVTLMLCDAAGNPLGISVVTDASGFYIFSGLRPGIYGIKEVQPVGYLDGLDTPGSAGGLAQNPGDKISNIPLIDVSGQAEVEYNFGELLPGSIRGRVHAEADDNCTLDPGDVPLAGVTIYLLDAHGVRIASTLTDDQGRYEFLNLAPGVYGVEEVQPSGYLQGGTKLGSGGGIVAAPDVMERIEISSNRHLVEYNFCEKLPASLRGRVHVDLDFDCTLDPGEITLEGVVIYLLDESGQRIAQTTTNSQGMYFFTNLTPGTYGVEEIQPAGYYQGGTKLGSAGGHVVRDDVMGGIVLWSGVAAVNYDFCERPPGSISGYVFQDGPPIVLSESEAANPPTDIALQAGRDGQRKPGDLPIAGVRLRLGNAFGEAILDASGKPIETLTNSAGFYRFDGLAPGLYTVLQDHPGGYLDGLDTQGTTGGIPFNLGSPVDPQLLSVDPKFDAIARIQVIAGIESQENNFSEVLVISEPRIFVTPPPDPLPPPPLRPPAAPLPQRLPPPAPLEPIVVLPAPYGGAAKLYTWHLSVINAGLPRQIVVGTPPQMIPSRFRFGAQTWETHELARGHWRLYSHRDGDPRQFVFGADGAIPVVGDFDGDGVSELGLFVDGEWFIDLNGNGVWDDGDLWARLGRKHDQPVVGDWDGDGKDDIGIFGPAWSRDPHAIAFEPGLPNPDNPTTGRFKNLPPTPQEATSGRRYLQRTANGDVREDLIDHVFYFGQPGDRAIAGDWTGCGTRSIGIFRRGEFTLDTNGNGRIDDRDLRFDLGFDGTPVVGDFNGDGVDSVGVYVDGTWLLDVNNDGRLDASDEVFSLGTPDDIPVVGDFNGDGIDEPGLYSPASSVSTAP